MRAAPLRFGFPLLIAAGILAGGAALRWHRATSATAPTARLTASRSETRSALHEKFPSTSPSLAPAALQAWADRSAPTHSTAQDTEALAALRNWAAEDPEAALAWARALTDNLRVAALVAALEGAANQPSISVRLGLELLRDEPALAEDCGPALVGALIRKSSFDAALEFARQGPPEFRTAWLTIVLGAWSGRDPHFAAELATLVLAQGLEGRTFAAVLENWASATPEQVAAYALTLPTGSARQTAFHESVARWAERDPAALAATLPRLTDQAERDEAAAALIAGTDTINRPTATALAWAETIREPALHLNALTRVAKEWARQDPLAVSRYIETAPRLSAEERAALLAALRPRPSVDPS